MIKEYPDMTLINCKIDEDKLKCILRKKGMKGKGIPIEDIDRIGASVGVNVNVSMISPKEVELFLEVMDKNKDKKYTCIIEDWRDERVLSCHIDDYWVDNPPKNKKEIIYTEPEKPKLSITEIWGKLAEDSEKRKEEDDEMVRKGFY